jgi:hypothetical protein
MYRRSSKLRPPGFMGFTGYSPVDIGEDDGVSLGMLFAVGVIRFVPSIVAWRIGCTK